MKELLQNIELPASKSISNRILIIKALCEYYNMSNKFEIENLAKCDDTNKMLLVLNLFFSHFNKAENNNNLSASSYNREFLDEIQNYNINHAGTAMRFLTAFLSIVKGECTLTGSERMQQRPIRILVDALNILGANIKYEKDEGYPPLTIKGCELVGGEIDIESSVSSQYISALMMIAPYMQKGLTINLVGGVVSSPYIFMTSQIMKQLDAKLCLYSDDEMDKVELDDIHKCNNDKSDKEELDDIHKRSKDKSDKVDKEKFDDIHKYDTYSTCSTSGDNSDSVDKEEIDNVHKFKTCSSNNKVRLGNVLKCTTCTNESEKKLRRIKIYPFPYLNSLDNDSSSKSNISKFQDVIESCGSNYKSDVSKLEDDIKSCDDNMYINTIKTQTKNVVIKIESDWSAASYFYEYLLIKGHGKLKLNNLYKDSIQGDSKQVAYWEQLGITTKFVEDAIIIEKGIPSQSSIKLDFTEMPDIALSFIVACCLAEIKFCFTGLQTLKIKECDRIESIITEMKKLNYSLVTNGLGILSWDGGRTDIFSQKNNKDVNQISIKTYNDHRMAMVMAPARILYPKLVIENPEVVEKSFPDYWKQTVHLS